MKSSSHNTVGKSERLNTDKSLNLERNRTDESISKSRAEIERMTDAKVEQAREKADKKKRFL